MQLRLALLAALATTSAGAAAPALPAIDFEGGMDTGGGHAVVCREEDGSIRSAELYDLYEARTLFGLAPLAAGLTESNRTGLLTLLERVPVRDRDRRDRIRRAIPGLLGDAHADEFAKYLDGIELPFIDDANVSIAPAGCRVEQLAVQRRPRFDGDPSYIINNDIFRALDAVNQVALLTHEVLYREARAAGEADSRTARRLNALLLADTWKDANYDTNAWNEYLATLRELGFSMTYTHRYSADRSDDNFYTLPLDLESIVWSRTGGIRGGALDRTVDAVRLCRGVSMPRVEMPLGTFMTFAQDGCPRYVPATTTLTIQRHAVDVFSLSAGTKLECAEIANLTPIMFEDASVRDVAGVVYFNEAGLATVAGEAPTCRDADKRGS